MPLPPKPLAVLATLVAQAGQVVTKETLFAAQAFPIGLTRMLHQRTEGNPLFLVAVVDELVRQGLVQQGPAGWVASEGLDAVSIGVPDRLRRLIEQQLEQLPTVEQQTLEAASVAGVEFAVAAVAAGIEQGVEAVEDCAAMLARRGLFMQIRGEVEWPDGRVTTRKPSICR